VLLAPAYNRNAAAGPPAQMSASAAFNTQSRDDFNANWDRQIGCPDQYDRATSDSVWAEMMASDPVGATWGPGVRRAPQTAVWGWTPALAGKTTIPTLLVAGIHDKQVSPQRVQELFADLGSKEKVLLDLGCSSHNAMWERNHLLMFKASLDWLSSNTVNGAKDGVVKLGY
jgi:pimeloyl-ACP methyl ester carboxylesterase